MFDLNDYLLKNLRAWTNSTNPHPRILAAANLALTEDLMVILAHDEDYWVLRTLKDNLKLPENLSLFVRASILLMRP